jgi:hypothetical protein
MACELVISGTEEHRRGRTYGFSDTLNVVTKVQTVALNATHAQTLHRRYGRHHCDKSDKVVELVDSLYSLFHLCHVQTYLIQRESGGVTS